MKVPYKFMKPLDKTRYPIKCILRVSWFTVDCNIAGLLSRYYLVMSVVFLLKVYSRTLQ